MQLNITRSGDKTTNFLTYDTYLSYSISNWEMTKQNIYLKSKFFKKIPQA
jgi:hypothetical protein